MSTKYLNTDNILKKVYDPSTEGLRTTAVASFVGGSVDISISDLTDSIKIGDGSGVYLDINPDGSINANVEVNAADGDNIAISDGTNTMSVNSDGSINVKIFDTLGLLKTFYNEVTSVASSILTTIQTYTVPVSTTAYLQKINISGTNIATYDVLINGVLQEKKRTWFNDGLNTEFDFSDYSKNGIPLITGDIVTVRVIHNRPSVGDFNSRVQVVEV